MRVCLTFIPTDGAEVSHQMYLDDLEAAPQVGDSILIRRPPATGYEAYIVKRRWWMLDVSESNPIANDVAHRLVIECHFARCECMDDEHRKSCDRYEGRGMTIVELPQLPQ